MHVPRGWAASFVLPDGSILVEGGYDSNSLAQYTTEIYDPATGHWSFGAPLPSVKPFWAPPASRIRVSIFEPFTVDQPGRVSLAGGLEIWGLGFSNLKNDFYDRLQTYVTGDRSESEDADEVADSEKAAVREAARAQLRLRLQGLR